MMNPRFFCPDGLLPDSDMALPAAVAHHAERVLRLAVGEAVTLFDGRGGECAATLVALGRQPLARLGPRLAVEREAPLAVTLVFGIARFANAATGDVMTLGAYAALSGAGLTGSLVLGGLFGLQRIAKALVAIAFVIAVIPAGLMLASRFFDRFDIEALRQA